jgi:hypothetical protein
MRMPRDGADPFFFLDPTRAHEGRCIGGGGRGLLGASMAVIDSLILGIRARADGENRRSVRKIVNLKFGSSEPGRSETSKDLSQTIHDPGFSKDRDIHEISLSLARIPTKIMSQTAEMRSTGSASDAPATPTQPQARARTAYIQERLQH